MNSINEINDQMHRGTKAQALNLFARALVMAAGGRIEVPNNIVARSNDIILEEENRAGRTVYIARWKEGAGPYAPRVEVLPPEPSDTKRLRGKASPIIHADEVDGYVKTLEEARQLGKKIDNAVVPLDLDPNSPDFNIQDALEQEGMIYLDSLLGLIRHGGYDRAHWKAKYPVASVEMLEEQMRLADECPVCLTRWVNTGAPHTKCWLPAAIIAKRERDKAEPRKAVIAAKIESTPGVYTPPQPVDSMPVHQVPLSVGVTASGIPMAKAAGDAKRYIYSYASCPGHWSGSLGGDCKYCGFPILTSRKDY